MVDFEKIPDYVFELFDEIMFVEARKAGRNTVCSNPRDAKIMAWGWDPPLLRPGKTQLTHYGLAAYTWWEERLRTKKLTADTKHTDNADRPNNRKKNVNAQMLDKLQKDEACRGWTAKKWATCLKCSQASVVATSTWKQLKSFRDKLKAEKARDRRGRGVGRRKDDYGES